MLGVQAVDARQAGAALKVIEGSIPFPQRDDALLSERRKKFPKTPDSALVKRFEHRLAIAPKRLKRLRIVRPPVKREFEEVAAVCATKVLCCRTRSGSAGNTTQTSGSGLAGGHVVASQPSR